MGLDWRTLLMQGVDFLLLLVILTWLLYRPLRQAVERLRAEDAAAAARRAAVDAAAAALAQTQAAQAAALAQQETEARARVATWEAQARAAAAAQAQEERRQVLAQGRAALAQERLAAGAALEAAALTLAQRWAERLLLPLADATLAERQLEALLTRLAQEPPSPPVVPAGPQAVVLTTSHPLGAAAGRAVARLTALLGPAYAPAQVRVDPGLLCGAEVAAGDYRWRWHWRQQLVDARVGLGSHD